jgi:sRNA-binding protein
MMVMMTMVATISMNRDAIAQLAEMFPQAFFMNHADLCPLKIGIAADLRALVPFAEEELEAVLRRYTASDGYLQASIEGTPRRDLDGSPVGVVDAHQAKHALKVLAEREAWRAKKKAARDRAAHAQPSPQPQATAGAQRHEQKATEKQAAADPDRIIAAAIGIALDITAEAKQKQAARIGFAELRAAAALRKTATK